MIYFQDICIEGKSREFPKKLKEYEKEMTYEKIQQMRNSALKKLDFINRKEKLENELNAEKSAYFGINKEKVEKLQKELEVKKEEEKNCNDSVERNLFDKVQQDDHPLKNMEDTYVNILAYFSI